MDMGGWWVLKIGQFSWTSYVYHSLVARMFDLLKNSEKLDLLNDQLFYFTTKQHEYVSKIVCKKTDE